MTLRLRPASGVAACAEICDAAIAAPTVLMNSRRVVVMAVPPRWSLASLALCPGGIDRPRHQIHKQFTKALLVNRPEHLDAPGLDRRIVLPLKRRAFIALIPITIPETRIAVVAVVVRYDIHVHFIEAAKNRSVNRVRRHHFVRHAERLPM